MDGTCRAHRGPPWTLTVCHFPHRDREETRAREQRKLRVEPQRNAHGLSLPVTTNTTTTQPYAACRNSGRGVSAVSLPLYLPFPPLPI